MTTSDVTYVVWLQRRLKAYLNHHDLQASEFARFSGVPTHVVHRFLRGSRPRSGALSAIEICLNQMEAQPHSTISTGLGSNSQANRLDVTILEPGLQPVPAEGSAWQDEINALDACWGRLAPLPTDAMYRVVSYLNTRVHDEMARRDVRPTQG